MFRAQVNPFDEVVTKATDENLTSENWEHILNVCDKVDANPENGSRDALGAIQKRLVHRSANVQLYALTLAEALSKNCGTKVHREMASRAFTQTLQRLVNDRATHSTVKSRIYELMEQWSNEFKSDPSLGIMQEAFDTIKQAPGIQAPAKPQKREITDADRRKEEEELQMALALSLSDTSISGPSQPVSQQQGQQQQEVSSPQESAQSTPHTTAATVSRVKALYDFTPTEAGELAFRKGDVISVLDSVFKDWWRGSLRGETGIFPVNYVEILPDPTPAELQRESEEEAKVFAESKNIELLLSMLSSTDPARNGAVAEDEQLQNLYHTTLAIRPKLVRLIEKYSQKKDDLIALNEKFIKARRDYDQLMEASMNHYSHARPPVGGMSYSGHASPPPAGPYGAVTVSPPPAQGGYASQGHPAALAQPAYQRQSSYPVPQAAPAGYPPAQAAVRRPSYDRVPSAPQGHAPPVAVGNPYGMAPVASPPAVDETGYVDDTSTYTQEPQAAEPAHGYYGGATAAPRAAQAHEGSYYGAPAAQEQQPAAYQAGSYAGADQHRSQENLRQPAHVSPQHSYYGAPAQQAQPEVQPVASPSAEVPSYYGSQQHPAAPQGGYYAREGHDQEQEQAQAPPHYQPPGPPADGSAPAPGDYYRR